MAYRADSKTYSRKNEVLWAYLQICEEIICNMTMTS